MLLYRAVADPDSAWAADTSMVLPADAGEDPSQYLYASGCGTTSCVVTGSYYTDPAFQQYQGVMWARTAG
ncbi:hypothetical protein ACIGXF_21040 [Streptomyces sp. NPDC053086]|uniref:hypothetical protein n=1 Tax=unclassified Streptomyces TaxID=2593676 RepID=UPI0037D49B37